MKFKFNMQTMLFVAIIAAVVYYYFFYRKIEGYESGPAEVSYSGPDDMTEYPNPDAYGTTADGLARWENLSVRPEALGSPGNVHMCKCGNPSKRDVDAAGGSWHQLPHMCAQCGGLQEPIQLGQWYNREGCGDPTSRGLNVVPHCTNC